MCEAITEALKLLIHYYHFHLSFLSCETPVSYLPNFTFVNFLFNVRNILILVFQNQTVPLLFVVSMNLEQNLIMWKFLIKLPKYAHKFYCVH